MRMKKIFTLALSATLLAGTSLSAIAETTTAYGYTWGERNNYSCGFISFDASAPQTIKRIKTIYSDYHVSAGEYIDGKLYTFRVEVDDFGNVLPYSYTIYDGTTYAEESDIKKYDESRVVDMTFDYTTNTLYAVAENAVTSGSVVPTNLYSIDMATGNRTLIGSPGALIAIDGYGNPDNDGLITLACDAEGQLYAMSAYRYFYKVDKFTGKVTQIGERHNLGTRADFQSMAFTADGKLMWAQNHPSYGHFVEIDLNTGNPGGFVDFKTDYDKLNKLGNDAQVTALNFRDREINRQALKAVDKLSAEVNIPEVHSVTLSWELPSADISEQAAAPNTIKVYRLGTSLPIAELDGSATSFTDTEAPDGTVGYEVIAENEAGFGYPAFTDVFAGFDMLSEVTDLTLSVEGRTATITWTAPTYTLNGGYADYENITYNIYRLRGTTEEIVKSGHEDTEFTETIDADGNYSYMVEPVSGTVVGKRAQSESFLLQSSASLPYFTGFEDDEDNSPWSTINNNPNNPGWTIGKEYTQYEGKCAKSYQGAKAEPANCWLISPAFNLDAGRYTIDYYVNGSSYDTHSYDVAVGTNADDVESFSQMLYSIDDAIEYDANATPKGWKHVELEFSIPTAGTYHIGFHDRTQAPYGYASLYLDNVSIDSKSSSIENVNAESEAGISISVARGVITVASASAIASVELIDMQGRTVKASTTAVLDATSNRGVYIVSATTVDGVRTIAKIAL